jgi:aminoglycoside phosphotransferase
MTDATENLNLDKSKEYSSTYIDWAKTIIGNEVVANQVMSADKNSVFEIDSGNDKYFLKVGANLKQEKEKLDWLHGRLPVPTVRGFTTEGKKEVLLMSAITGENLAVLATKWDPEKVINKLVSALHRFHSTDTKDCPFGEHKPNSVLVHGDACLPNFIYHNEEFMGYIDLGDMQAGNVEIDLSAAVWTLQYNFGPGHGVRFLQEYGITGATEEMAEKLREAYEAKI